MKQPNSLVQKTLALFFISVFSVTLFAPAVYADQFPDQKVPVSKTFKPSDFAGLMGFAAQQISRIPSSTGVTEKDKQEAYATLYQIRQETFAEFFTQHAVKVLSTEGVVLTNALGSDAADLQTGAPASSTSIVTKGSADIPPELLNQWRFGLKAILRCMVAGKPFGPQGIDTACASGNALVDPEKVISDYTKQLSSSGGAVAASGASFRIPKNVQDAIDMRAWKDAALFTYQTNPVVRTLLDEYTATDAQGNKGVIYDDVGFVNKMLDHASTFEKNQQYGLAFYAVSISLPATYGGDDETERFISFLNNMPATTREGYRVISACLDEGHNLGAMNALYHEGALPHLRTPDEIDQEVTRRMFASAPPAGGAPVTSRATLLAQVQQDEADKIKAYEPTFASFACLQNNPDKYRLLGLALKRDPFLAKVYRSNDAELKTPAALSQFLKDIESAKALADQTANQLLAQGHLSPGATRSALLLMTFARGQQIIKNHQPEFDAAKPGFLKRSLKALPACLTGAAQGFAEGFDPRKQASYLNYAILGIYLGASGFSKLGFPPSVPLSLAIDGVVISALTTSTALSVYETSLEWDSMDQNSQDVARCSVLVSGALILLPIKSAIKNFKKLKTFPTETPKIDATRLEQPIETAPKTEIVAGKPRVTLPSLKTTASAVGDFLSDFVKIASEAIYSRIPNWMRFAPELVPVGYGELPAINYGDLISKRFEILKARLKPKIWEQLGGDRLYMSSSGSSGGSSGSSGGSGGGGEFTAKQEGMIALINGGLLIGGAFLVLKTPLGANLLSGYVGYATSSIPNLILTLVLTTVGVKGGFVYLFKNINPGRMIVEHFSQGRASAADEAAHGAAQPHPPAGGQAAGPATLTSDEMLVQANARRQLTIHGMSGDHIEAVMPAILAYFRQRGIFPTDQFFIDLVDAINTRTSQGTPFGRAVNGIFTEEFSGTYRNPFYTPDYSAQAGSGAAPQGGGNPGAGNAGPGTPPGGAGGPGAGGPGVPPRGAGGNQGGGPQTPPTAPVGPEEYRFAGNWFTRLIGPKVVPENPQSTAGALPHGFFRGYRDVMRFLDEEYERINPPLDNAGNPVRAVQPPTRVLNPGTLYNQLAHYTDFRFRLIGILTLLGIGGGGMKILYDLSFSTTRKPPSSSPSPGTSVSPSEPASPAPTGPIKPKPKNRYTLENSWYDLTVAYADYQDSRDALVQGIGHVKYATGPDGQLTAEAKQMKASFDAILKDVEAFDSSLAQLETQPVATPG